MFSTDKKIKWQKRWEEPCILEYASYNFQEIIETILDERNQNILQMNESKKILANKLKQKQPNQKSRTEKFNIWNILKTLNRLHHKIDMKKSTLKRTESNNEMIESQNLRVMQCETKKGIIIPGTN